MRSRPTPGTGRSAPYRRSTMDGRWPKSRWSVAMTERSSPNVWTNDMRGGQPMKSVMLALMLVATTTYAIAAEEKTTMKYDLGVDSPKWKFVAGQWVRRPSGGRQVLAQTVETQPWAVAVLEEQKFADLDVSVRFRPISGKEDASGGIIFRARDGRNYFLVRANALENNFRLYTIVNGKRSTIASARVTEPS